MKTKLSLLALISAAVLPCSNALAEEYNVIIYDEGEVPQSETTDLNAAVDYINGADGDIVELWANMELSSALDIDLDSEFYLRSDGTTKRLISGKEMYRHIDFSADELTIYCTNIVFTSGTSTSDKAYISGGSIRGGAGRISLGGDAEFFDNCASTSGVTSSASFDTEAVGGAIVGGELTILKKANISFSENTTSNSLRNLRVESPDGNDIHASRVIRSQGGAVSAPLVVQEGASVSFSKNEAYANFQVGSQIYQKLVMSIGVQGGGVFGNFITGKNVRFQFEQNSASSQVTFSFHSEYSPKTGSLVSVEGGAICGSSVQIGQGSEGVFLSNVVNFKPGEYIFSNAEGEYSYPDWRLDIVVRGGAIAADTVEFFNSTDVSFIGNAANMTLLDSGNAFAPQKRNVVKVTGGAVAGAVKIGENAKIVFSQNTVAIERASELKYPNVTETVLGVCVMGGGAISGSLEVRSGANVKFIENSTVSTGTYPGSLSCGGAFYGSDVSLAGASVEFSANSAKYKNGSVTDKGLGGAIYASGKVSFEAGLNSVLFSQNKAERGFGGAIYGAGTSSSVVFSDAFSGTATFTSNSSANGGAVYTQGSLVLSGLGGTIFFDNNLASSAGGAIYASGSFSSTDYTTASFSGNKAQGGNGGAIYIATTPEGFGGTLSFVGNQASASGGGIYGASAITTNRNTTLNFSQNTAVASGGAIYGAKTLAFSNGSNLTFKTNEATSGSGGAIYGVGQVAIGEQTTLDFSGNKAGASGGAIYSEANVGFSGSGSFRGNSAKASGGAIYATTKVRMAPKTDVEFSANSAKDGGAIYAGTVADIVARSVSFVGNTASNYGGAIYVNSGSADFSGTANVSFSKNSALNGGAIYTASNFRNGTTSTFSENTASNLGGAISGVTTIDVGATVTFSGNKAATGGAINGTTTIYGNVEFSDNTAASATRNVFGGAISGSTVTVDASEATQTKFIGNKIILESGDYNFRGGAISASNVNLKGGSILFQGNSASGVGSSSVESGGGAIYAANSVVFESDANVTFKGNTVLNDATQTFGGGAIYGNFITLAGTLNFENNSVTNTRSGRSEWYSAGGAVFSFGGLTVSKDTNAIFAGNSAAYGGAIDAYKGDLTFAEGAKVRFSGNSAAQGGAIYVDAGTFTLAGDVAFTDNTATTYGGAIRIAGTTLRGMGNTTQVVFSGNKVGTDAKGWKNNDIYMTNAKGVVALQDAGTYTFGGGIDGSKGGSLTIGLDAGGNVTGGTRVTFKAGAVNAIAGDVTIAGSGTSVCFENADNAFSGNLVVANSANVTMERGATLDLLAYGSLSVTSNSEFVVRTDLAGATVINVGEGASVSFDNTAKLVIDLSTSMPATRSVSPVSGEAVPIAIICASADASIGEINNIELRVDGSVFTGDWSLSKENNTLYLVASIPEPSAFGLLAGLGALLLVGTRRRRNRLISRESKSFCQ